MAGQLLVSLSEATVHANGRPKAAPRTMAVGLVVQLVDPVRGAVLASDSLTFSADAGETLSPFRIVPGTPEGDTLPLFRGAQAVPDPVLLDVRFVVSYQNALGPIVGAVINKLIDLGADVVPLLGDAVAPRLHLKIGDTVTEEYGRQTLLWSGAAEGGEPRTAVLDLAAPETIRGFYFLGATGRTTPRPVSAVFLEKGEVAATVALRLERVDTRAKKPKARPKKAPARRARAARS